MSEITKFTKGSWYINDCGIHWNNPDLKHLEVCYSEIGEVVCDTVYTEADANLIAAAPEMYKMLDDLANGRGVDYPIEQLLAKARGKVSE